jgi:hypothetical protein
MKYLITFVCLLACHFAIAQAPVVESPDNARATLDERFQSMKSKAETYQDYKVIKAYTLDGFWKIVMDTVRAAKASRAESARAVATAETQAKEAQLTLQQKEASMGETLHGSTHISFLGVDFGKGVFVTIVIVVVLGLLLALAGLAGRIKIMQSFVKEKEVQADVLTREFDEYKHKALEKQTKLSRELQNERNKLSEMRKN